MNESHVIKTIAVTGGKGGVGKTNVAVNVAQELLKNNKSVLLLDADLGMANIDIMLNLKPRFDLSHVVTGQCELEEVILEGPQGLNIVPASSGIGRMAQLNSFEQANLIKAFSNLENQYDVLVIDTAAGISPDVISFTKAAQEIIVVLCDEPTSLADAYALIKVLSREHGVKKFQLLANMVASPEQGKQLYSRLTEVTDLYLDVVIGYLGSIPTDDNIRKAIKARSTVTQKYPYSASSIAFQKLAKRIVEIPALNRTNGCVEFFVEQTLSTTSVCTRGV